MAYNYKISEKTRFLSNWNLLLTSISFTAWTITARERRKRFLLKQNYNRIINTSQLVCLYLFYWTSSLVFTQAIDLLCRANFLFYVSLFVLFLCLFCFYFVLFCFCFFFVLFCLFVCLFLLFSVFCFVLFCFCFFFFCFCFLLCFVLFCFVFFLSFF